MTKSFKEKIKVIISCGGTGGHIYPAIARIIYCYVFSFLPER